MIAQARIYDLVAFDVDGTLVHHRHDKTVWEVLNRRFTGGDEQNRERYALYKSGKLSYAEWVELDITSWQEAGATREAIVEAIDELRLVRGARETMAALKTRGVRLVVISGTLDLLIDVLFPEHPFDEIYANAIAFDDAGRIGGWRATPFDMDGKAVALRSIAMRERIPLRRCVFVGDHANDLSAFRVAGLAIAFNPKDAGLEEAAGAIVRSDDLRDILPLILGTPSGEDSPSA